MKLTSEKIYLRYLNINDTNGNYPNWLNDPIVCKYNSHGDKLYTKDMAKEYIEFVTNSPIHKVFAICDSKTDQHIGNISLQQISQKNKSAEFAILLGEKEFMGKGYANEASKLLIDYGFKRLKLHRIYCGTSILNIPMQKLALSIGMKKKEIKKHTLLKNGKFINTIEYAITNNTL